jgi:septal ring factor EnvC (AmiA/AmiB activator)
MIVLYILMLLVIGTTAYADDKKDYSKDVQACQEQLLTTKVKAQNLDEQRDRATQEKSSLQVQLYHAQQELSTVKKELEELKGKK